MDYDLPSEQVLFVLDYLERHRCTLTVEQLLLELPELEELARLRQQGTHISSWADKFDLETVGPCYITAKNTVTGLCEKHPGLLGRVLKHQLGSDQLKALVATAIGNDHLYRSQQLSYRHQVLGHTLQRNNQAADGFQELDTDDGTTIHSEAGEQYGATEGRQSKAFSAHPQEVADPSPVELLEHVQHFPLCTAGQAQSAKKYFSPSLM